MTERQVKETTDWQSKPVQRVDDVADILDVHSSTVRDAIKAGTIPSIRCGRRILVPTEGLKRLLQLAS